MKPPMTSAVLASRDEVHHGHPHHRRWGGARAPLMPKPSSNHNPRRYRPGPNPIVSGSPPAPRAGSAVAAEPLPSPLRHVKFRPSELTPAEARHLRERLTGELGRVRAFVSRIDSWQDGRRSSPPPALVEAMWRRCADILTRLRRSKKSVWFNSPVDVEGLKLHDYRAIIRSPMDLGTVKQNLTAGRYPSHEAFAGDVRLTFNNALRYNPPDHHVHRYAGNLLASFEGMYKEAVSWFEQQRQQLEPPMQPDLPPPPPQLPVVSVPVQAPPRMGGGGRRPKPKAREPNKREMDEEEKQKLRVEIENLPEEKMLNVLQIVQKRNSDPAFTGEVVELDFDELDMETLWELDRFVVNWRKALKKSQRNSMVNGDAAAAVNGDAIDVTVVPDDDDMVEVAVNPSVAVEIGESVWHSEGFWLFLYGLLTSDVWTEFRC